MIGDKIRRLRKAGKISQEELGKRIGVARHTILRWENGKRSPEADLLPELAKILNTTILFLLEEADGETQEKQVPEHPTFLKSTEVIKSEHWVTLPVLDIASIDPTAHDVGEILETYRGTSRIIEIPKEYIGALSTDPNQRPFVVIVRDDSMEDANIPNGAEVVVNPAERICDGDPAFIHYGSNGDWAIKWVYLHRSGAVELRVASLKYPPRVFPRADINLGLFRPIGKIMKVIVNPKRGM